MAEPVVATLDTLGWVTEPSIGLDRIFAYWIAARKDQSLIIKDIESFQYVKEQYQSVTDKNIIIDAIKLSLTNAIREVYKNIDHIAVEEINPDTKAAIFSIKISATIIHNEKKFDLLKSIELNSKTYELVEKGRNNDKSY